MAGEIVASARSERFDAVYLCLHGAMVTEHLEDGEGELLRRVREAVGKDCPVVASLDFHTNNTPLMVSASDALVVYRTYPHIDMAATGQRTARYLDTLMREGRKPAVAFAQIPFLIPLNWQCTTTEPMSSLIALSESLESSEVDSVSLSAGFPAADIYHCGASVLAYGRSQRAVDRAVQQLSAAIVEAEGAFDGRLYEPAEAVEEAMRLSGAASRPVVIADTQDNPGAGGDSDTTGILRALVELDAQSAALGIMVDAQAAEAAHRAGVGAELTLSLGGKSGIEGDSPFEATFKVEALGDGNFEGTGPMYRASQMTLGLMACLSIRGVRVVVGSRKAQLADQSIYRHVGIEPTKQRLLVNKSSVHFRADFEPIAEAILVCVAPGPMVADPAALPWTRLRPGLRIKPNGRPFSA